MVKSFWYAAQETFLIIINVENSCANTVYLFQGSFDIFYNNVKVFTVTFLAE